MSSDLVVWNHPKIKEKNPKSTALNEQVRFVEYLQARLTEIEERLVDPLELSLTSLLTSINLIDLTSNDEKESKEREEMFCWPLLLFSSPIEEYMERKKGEGKKPFKPSLRTLTYRFQKREMGHVQEYLPSMSFSLHCMQQLNYLGSPCQLSSAPCSLSLSELAKLCRKLEEVSLRQQDNRRNGSTQSINVLEPDLAYISENSSMSQYNPATFYTPSHNQSSKTLDPSSAHSEEFNASASSSKGYNGPSRVFSNSKNKTSSFRDKGVNFNRASNKPSNTTAMGKVIICWNYRQPNHTLQNCTLKRNKFCFKGGKANVTVSSCTKCSDAVSIDFKNNSWEIAGPDDIKISSLGKTDSSIPENELGVQSKEILSEAQRLTSRGLFHFNVLPFGLTNAAQAQQRLIDAIFGPEFEPYVFCSLDDIILISPDFDHHINLLREVKSRLDEANLTINLKKCEFLKPSLKYLGYVIDGTSGLPTNPDKVLAMIYYPPPQTTTEVKRFVGMCSWYRRFIPHFSSLMAPINDLIIGKKNGGKTIWTNEANDAFINIKQALISAPVLATPDFSLPFTLQCDASEVGLGCVLTQDQAGVEKVIAFASRSLSRAERNYSATEKECLAVVFGVEKFRAYIEETSFTVITDDHSLLWLHRMKDPSGKLARSPVEPPCIENNDICVGESENISHQIDLDNVDNFYKQMRRNILNQPDKYPQWSVENNFVYKFVPCKLAITSNISDSKLLVPKKQRRIILSSMHDNPTAAHLGFAKTLARVSLIYYWPKMRLDIYRYIRACKTCNSQKASTSGQFGLMGAQKSVRFPFQIIAVDLMGPLPKSISGNSYLLVVSDWLTKFVLLKPLRKASASNCIICDNGTQFTSSIFKDVVKSYKSNIWYTAKYHPQANFVERSNRTIGTAIRSYIKSNHKHWDKNIAKIGYSTRTAQHEVTGHSPTFLNFFRYVPRIGDYYGNIPPNELNLSDLEMAYKRNANNYNLRKRDIEFNIGDKVWKKNMVLSSAPNDFSKKLAPRYVLCTVKKKLSKLVYRLDYQDGSDAGEWHVKHLKPYYGSMSDLS
ncbi:hypothetical protein ILUMI_00997 [Ignelater luminosus]|uniref:RNA-directed DNA polymerase n=1 Tax=Ignelater luminosus TaxID=2038154 RepID=A0A8K0GKP4_IGNLU|nr:hypothetical protein ILUMI_00997 [Ignelater luminosus]